MRFSSFVSMGLLISIPCAAHWSLAGGQRPQAAPGEARGQSEASPDRKDKQAGSKESKKASRRAAKNKRASDKKDRSQAGEGGAFNLFGIYAETAPRASAAEPRTTSLPLKLEPGARVALIGNNLLDRGQYFGYLESLLHQHWPNHGLIVRNLAWSGDTPDLQPRPANFADWEQHLTHERVDVVLAAFGFNESFAGQAGQEPFRQALTRLVRAIQTKAFNGKHAPQIVLVSPIANENVGQVLAADRNNANIEAYAQVIRQVARQEKVGYIDAFTTTYEAMSDVNSDLTINGCHLNDAGYRLFAKSVFEQLFAATAPVVNESVRKAVLDKNRQYFRRYRPLNTFYYTGGRRKTYGYLDFLPAMRNFDLLTSNRDRWIHALAGGKDAEPPQDANIPPLPKVAESRGANRWMSAEDERKAFKVDPRFEVTLFAGEEEFPDLAAPIQMRWDAQGRLWVSCSTTYPHVYPGNEPNDKLIILEDLDGDGKADKSSVFAEDLHIPLSFEFGDGGVYVSEMPHLTFLKDTDGDGKADQRRIVLSGFGTEDSHHALHDFAWTPDGDLIFRESIFHHSQVETPYGPVRQQNSGWFRFQPRTQRLISFGSYHSTNPWGVTFDDWGQHQASHPIFASAFHALDPPYPQQHPKPSGLRAYSGTCGQEFVDFSTFPEELQGGFIKVRYKPTNRVEIHKWNEYAFGYDEEYVSDLIFSSNLSFIPVDIRFGPRGALYICDWYNPVKGHAQYSLRDERRDRHSGRIWRITTKGKPLVEPPKIADASIAELLELLKRPEYRYRYWAKRELRECDPDEVKQALDVWVEKLDPLSDRFRHHQVEAMWLYRNIDRYSPTPFLGLLACDEPHARAAATRQLRYWHDQLPNAAELLRNAANDPHGLVRLEAAVAASYVGTRESLEAILEIANHPLGGHLAYAFATTLGSRTLRPHWEQRPEYGVPALMARATRARGIVEPPPNPREAEFDALEALKVVRVGCLPERMRFSVEQITATVGQPLKIVFQNADATDHNMVFVANPEAMAEVGMAANAMARDPKNANSDFVPPSHRDQILHFSPMIGPTRKKRIHVFRFRAPDEPGVYPYVCTFPGHWVVMNGILVVGSDPADAAARLAEWKPRAIKQWTLDDFEQVPVRKDQMTLMRGMQAFVKAQCHQCHKVAGHGVELGPNLSDVSKRFRGRRLLQQILDPSSEVNEKFQTHQFLMDDGQVISGVIAEESETEFRVIPNLLAPKNTRSVRKSQIAEQAASRISPMPTGLADTLTREEILDLISFLENGELLPDHLKHHQPK